MQSTYVIHVGNSDAAQIRSMLRKHRLEVTVVEVRQWMFWRRFTVTGPPQAIRRIEQEHAEWDTDRMLDRAW